MARVPPPKRRQVAYGMAKRADPVGRLSDKDIEFQRKRLLSSEKKKRKKKNPDPAWSNVS